VLNKLSNVGRNIIYGMKWSNIKDKVELSQISSSPFSLALKKPLVLALLLFYGAFGTHEVSIFGSANRLFQLLFANLQLT
jgi:hypothetical protein